MYCINCLLCCITVLLYIKRLSHKLRVGSEFASMDHDDAMLHSNSTWFVTLRLDTTCRAELFDKLDTGKMHGLDTSNVSCRVETFDVSRRDVTSQVEYGLYSLVIDFDETQSVSIDY